MAGPLSHLRVLDLSRVLAGPWASQNLADLGADVIKVERPGAGDDTRGWGPPFLQTRDGSRGDAAYFLAVNRGKRSITIALDKPEGQRIVRELAKNADIVIENYKVGTLARYGLDYASLAAVNPKLIYCSVTGFGQDGPKAEHAAYDFAIQAMGGMMSITGEPEERGGTPQKVGIPIIDLMTGMYATVGILAALAKRDRTGVGEFIDVAMLDVQVGVLLNQGMNYLMTGRTPLRTGNAHPNLQPQNVYPCQDGSIVIAAGNDGQYQKLCEVIGRPELKNDPRFNSPAGRVTNRLAFEAILIEHLKTAPRAVWADKLEGAGVPCGPINTVPEVFDSPQVKHRQMLRTLPHALADAVPQIANPLRFTNAPIEYANAPPTLGAHTDEILAEIGITCAAVTELRTKGIL
jgi:crotonobetainyl-CoA:carnitine CoA-transferase CaiB-like acyl-CoA transferase